MKHEITSLQTKQLMANALKKRMEAQPLSKITVRNIIEDCGLNRNTFYYHFTDIYALLDWMLKQETVKVIEQIDLLTNYEDAIRFVLHYVQNNKHILSCSYEAMGRAGLRRFFYDDFMHVLDLLICELEKRVLLHMDDRTRQFVCEFYTEALAGNLLRYIAGENNDTEEEIIRNIGMIIKCSLPQILILADEKQKWENNAVK